MTNYSSYEDTVVAKLHIQPVVMMNIHSLMNIILDATSSNYARWRDNMMLTLTRYTLIEHIESDDDTFPDDPS
jgi:hypothetical protein